MYADSIEPTRAEYEAARAATQDRAAAEWIAELERQAREIEELLAVLRGRN